MWTGGRFPPSSIFISRLFHPCLFQWLHPPLLDISRHGPLHMNALSGDILKLSLSNHIICLCTTSQEDGFYVMLAAGIIDDFFHFKLFIGFRKKKLICPKSPVYEGDKAWRKRFLFPIYPCNGGNLELVLCDKKVNERILYMR